MRVDYLKRHWMRMTVSLAILLVFGLHVGRYISVGFVDRLENFAYDARLLFTLKSSQDPRVVIVDIDEKSLAEEGRWPWGRDKLASMMDALFDHYAVELVGFDVVFAERDESSGLQVLESLAETVFSDSADFRARLEQIRPNLDNDALFAKSLAGRSVVLGYYFSEVGEGGEAPHAGVLPAPVFGPDEFKGRTIDFKRARGFGANLPELQANAAGAGHFNPEVDPDGVVRRVPMLYEYADQYYESLSLSVARQWLGLGHITPGYPPDSSFGGGYSGMEWLQLGDRRIPVDHRARALVPFRGRQGAFPYLSASDVLNKRLDKAQLAGRIVLVGTSAPGLLDLRSVPVQNVYPGVEIHANLISGILDGALKENPPYMLGGELLLLVLSGLVMTLALPALSPLWASLATGGLLTGILGLNLWVWQHGNLVVPLAATLLMVVVMFLFHMSWGYFVESRGKRQLAGLFGQYVPPELVDEMSADPDSFSMEGESREMTVLFSDVRSFTTISEGLNPKELSRLMNAFLTPMTEIIHDYRGTIDKYMGDAIMAFWGAPLRDAEHARHAVEAGLKMVEHLASMQDEFRAQGWPPIRIGVGVNTGEMNVGNMGSEFRMAYTVLGDAVNLGSRLEGLTKNYGVQIIVSEFTRAALSDYAYRELDRVRVKGKDKPVTIYEPLGSADQLPSEVRKELDLYQQALRLYRAQDWDMAELQFLNLGKAHPERALYGLYLERIAHYRAAPPGADWDGVFTHVTK